MDRKPRRKSKPRGGKVGHPINGTHPRARYWREWKRMKKLHNKEMTP